MSRYVCSNTITFGTTGLKPVSQRNALEIARFEAWLAEPRCELCHAKLNHWLPMYCVDCVKALQAASDHKWTVTHAGELFDALVKERRG